ncbi:hypothetical protein [Cylindrospermum sp. FACHB-282]|uniref:hypothetical protein n=1 Tax=Cylindrospermum sp. FACHB-282 TaxID=2692794 RepID=UPI0016820B7B|nr:hypothetical protein [Cylindrospermum sp. FACHB-282]MBD2385345.1 hypothetical protein [Cylindrospermum sp. FACHB-282]
MISTPSLSTNFNQYALNTTPETLQVLFNKIKLKHYEELYEPEADGTALLEDDLNAVIEVLGDSDKPLNHLRYIWMTLILSLAVEPTLEYYDPNNSLPKIIIKLLEELLRTTINSSSKSISIIPDNLDYLINNIFKSHKCYFQKEGANFQAISEALDVFYNAMRVINYNQAVEAILELLDDCLEGYAVFPGSYGRRELFDWWLLDVVPASYNLLPPKLFYVVEGVKNKEEIKLRQTRLLNKISNEIKSSMPKLILKSHIPYNNNIFTPPVKMNIGSFEYSRKINNLSEITQLIGIK